MLEWSAAQGRVWAAGLVLCKWMTAASQQDIFSFHRKWRGSSALTRFTERKSTWMPLFTHHPHLITASELLLKWLLASNFYHEMFSIITSSCGEQDFQGEGTYISLWGYMSTHQHKPHCYRHYGASHGCRRRCWKAVSCSVVNLER